MDFLSMEGANSVSKHKGPRKRLREEEEEDGAGGKQRRSRKSLGGHRDSADSALCVHPALPPAPLASRHSIDNPNDNLRSNYPSVQQLTYHQGNFSLKFSCFQVEISIFGYSDQLFQILRGNY